jgi:hypothetical protein
MESLSIINIMRINCCIFRKTGLLVLFFSCSIFSFAQQTNSRAVAPIKTPVSLRADISVEKVMTWPDLA